MYTQLAFMFNTIAVRIRPPVLFLFLELEILTQFVQCFFNFFRKERGQNSMQ